MEKTLREAAKMVAWEWSEYGHVSDGNARELKAALDREADDGWISVEERLPKWGERVCVWTEECVSVAARWNVPKRDWVWEWPDGKKAHVTHWQPLPAPPKETP